MVNSSEIFHDDYHNVFTDTEFYKYEHAISYCWA